MTSSVRLHQVLLGTAVVVPAALFGAAAWQNERDVMREGRDSIQRTAAVMQEHARKVFETAELAIGQVNERIDDHSWAQIGAPATSEFLSRLKAPMEQLVSIWIADGDGIVRAGSQPWPAGSGIATREFFTVHRGGPRSIYVGAPFTGVATTRASFAVSFGIRSAGGAFDGTIHAAVNPDYFTRFYSEVAPPLAHVAILFRDDGAVLAREPNRDDRPSLDSRSPVMRHVAADLNGGSFAEMGSDGVLQDYAFQRVGQYPAYVAFAVPRPVLMAQWYRNMRVYGAVAGVAALTLLLVSWLALRRAVSEESALALLRDETRQRAAAEQTLRHAQRLEAVGQLTGGVAHDFNNLLTAILGNLELIQRAAAAPDGGARIQRLSATAIKAVQRGAALTKSLLAFSRKQPLQPRAIDADALLEEFADLMRQAAGSAVEIRIDASAALPSCIADPAELEAALLNLVINARDALAGCGRAGWVHIRTRVAVLDEAALMGNAEARPGLFVAIAVADNGPGMAADVAGKAFEPFFTTKPIGQGTGLGLSQVFGFARQLGGHVALDSVAGEGTVITVFLPVADSLA